MIAETDWPEACTGVSLSEPRSVFLLIRMDSFFTRISSIPVSASGQQEWVRDIESVLNGLNGKGLGVIYWEPGWIGNAGLGSSCSVGAPYRFLPASAAESFLIL